MADRGDHAASFAANRQLWEAWTAVHAEADFYDLEGFRGGGIRPGSGRFVLPPGSGELPLAFSLRATRPSTG